MSENKKLLDITIIFLLLAVVYSCFRVYSGFVNVEKDVAVDFIPFYRAAVHAVNSEFDVVYDTKFSEKVLKTIVLVNSSQGNGGVVLEKSFAPYLYPPHSLLFLGVLGYFEYAVALCAWFLLHIVILAAVFSNDYMKNILPTTLSCFTKIAVYLPFLFAAFIAGQNGILWSALLLAVLAMRKSRPIIAGLILSLFSMKPQIAIFIPMLLLFERNFRVLIIAGAAFLVMVVVSVLVFGSKIWYDYFEIIGYFSQIVKIGSEQVFISASPFSAFRLMGIKTDYAFVLQIIISVVTFLIFCRNVRSCKTEENIILLVVFSTFLFSFYSFIYDAVFLALPCLIFLKIEMQTLNENKLSPYIRILFLMTAFYPVLALTIHQQNVPYCFITILFGFILANIMIVRDKKQLIKFS